MKQALKTPLSVTQALIRAEVSDYCERYPSLKWASLGDQLLWRVHRLREDHSFDMDIDLHPDKYCLQDHR